MNWKKEAVDRLKKFDVMRCSTLTIPKEIQRLQTEACSIRSARTDGTPVRGGGNRREEAMLNNMVRRQNLQWALDQANLWVKVTLDALSALNPEEKLILHRFFLYPEKGSVERLCRELGVEQSSVYRKRDQALYKFTMALYGAVES